LIKIRSESAEVLYPGEDIVVVSTSDLQELKRLALLNPRQRVRLCAHRSPTDRLHEMFIVHAQDCYVRPHKHIQKNESMTILEGEVDVVLFNENGKIREINQLGAPETGKIFYQRLPQETYHMLIIRTELLVFHEITEGPFRRVDTIFPDWAPAEEDITSMEYVKKIKSLIHEKSVYK